MEGSRSTASPLPKTRNAIAAILALGFLVRLVALFFARHAALTSDAADYVTMAQQLRAGVHFVPYWPPGLPLFLEPVAFAGIAAQRAIMLLVWALCCWAFVRLARALGLSDGQTWLPLLVFSLLPASIHLSVEPLTQLPAAALLLTAAASAVLCAKGAGSPEWLLLGASLGALTLVRPSALPLLLMLPGFALWRSRRLPQAALAVALGSALVGGWMLHARALCGKAVLNTANAQNLWDGNNPDTPLYRTWYFGSHAKPGSAEIDQFPAFRAQLERADRLTPLERPAFFQALTSAYISSHPALFLLRTANRIRCFWGFDTFTSLNLRKARGHVFLLTLPLEALLYFALAGTAIFWMAAAASPFWRSWQTWLLLIAIVLYAAPYWVSMSHPTYHYPVLALLALLGLLGRDASDGAATHRARGWVAVAIFAAVQVEWIIVMSGQRG